MVSELKVSESHACMQSASLPIALSDADIMTVFQTGIQSVLYVDLMLLSHMALCNTLVLGRSLLIRSTESKIIAYNNTYRLIRTYSVKGEQA